VKDFKDSDELSAQEGNVYNFVYIEPLVQPFSTFLLFYRQKISSRKHFQWSLNIHILGLRLLSTPSSTYLEYFLPEPDRPISPRGNKGCLYWWVLNPAGRTDMIGRPPCYFLCCQSIPYYNLQPSPESSVEVQIIELKGQEVTQTSLLGSSTDSTNSSVSLKTACKQRFKHLIVWLHGP
jgi:hypothetical protein